MDSAYVCVYVHRKSSLEYLVQIPSCFSSGVQRSDNFLFHADVVPPTHQPPRCRRHEGLSQINVRAALTRRPLVGGARNKHQPDVLTRNGAILLPGTHHRSWIWIPDRKAFLRLWQMRLNHCLTDRNTSSVAMDTATFTWTQSSFGFRGALLLVPVPVEVVSNLRDFHTHTLTHTPSCLRFWPAVPMEINHRRRLCDCTLRPRLLAG